MGERMQRNKFLRYSYVSVKFDMFYRHSILLQIRKRKLVPIKLYFSEFEDNDIGFLSKEHEWVLRF